MGTELATCGLSHGGWLRCVAVTALSVALAVGCSRIQFAYRQLDWFLLHYIESYITLTDEQRSYAEQRVSELLAWHCRTQLPAYSSLLRQASAEFQAGDVTRERVADLNRRIRLLWAELMQTASPAIAGLLATTSDAQVEELAEGFAKRNAGGLSELSRYTEQELREKYRDRMTSELERWFGPLTQAQQEAVSEWSGRFAPLGEEGLSVRAQWQARLLEVARRRGDEKALYTGIEELFASPQGVRTHSYQKLLDHNEGVTIDLIVWIVVHLDKDQRDYMARQAAAVTRDLDQLVCAQEPRVGPAESVTSSPVTTRRLALPAKHAAIDCVG